MRLILWLIIILLVVILVYLLCLRPNIGRYEAMQPFMDTYIAHRGFFNNRDIPENSLPAFAAAVEKGYGIELDVQLTADDRLVVFHDTSLERMCGVAGRLIDCTYEEVCSYRLLDTQEGIPLFEEVLKIVDGKVPLIVEIKSAGRYIKTAAKAAELLDNYKGAFCVESFHPLVVAWYKKKRPQVIRGQLSTDFKRDNAGKTPIERFVLTNLLFNGYSQPDFIAYNHMHSNQFSYRICKALYPVVNVAWTIRSQEELATAKKEFDVFIFEGFTPKEQQ